MKMDFNYLNPKNYTEEIFGNDMEYASKILELFLELIPVHRQKLFILFEQIAFDKFYKLSTQLLTVFRMIGKPEFSDLLYLFACDFKIKPNDQDLQTRFDEIINQLDLIIEYARLEHANIKIEILSPKS